MGGLLAFIYFFTVALCMPSSRAIPRTVRPFRFAFCTAFHLAVCSGVGFLGGGLTGLRTLLAPLGPATAMSFPTWWTGSRVASLVTDFPPRPLPLTLVGRWETGVCPVLPARPQGLSDVAAPLVRGCPVLGAALPGARPISQVRLQLYRRSVAAQDKCQCKWPA